jgi:flagellar basal body-associated protein FliL
MGKMARIPVAIPVPGCSLPPFGGSCVDQPPSAWRGIRILSMKLVLLMIAVAVLAGCGKKAAVKKPEPPEVATSNLIADATVLKAVSEHLIKNPGNLTKTDLDTIVELTLSYTQISDAGLKELAKLKRMTHLYLNNTEITDTGLKELARLKQLKSIALQGSKITDAGIRELLKLPNLIELDLRRTKVTKRGVGWVQRALPRCRLFIEFDKLSALNPSEPGFHAVVEREM